MLIHQKVCPKSISTNKLIVITDLEKFCLISRLVDQFQKEITNINTFFRNKSGGFSYIQIRFWQE